MPESVWVEWEGEKMSSMFSGEGVYTSRCNVHVISCMTTMCICTSINMKLLREGFKLQHVIGCGTSLLPICSDHQEVAYTRCGVQC